MLVKWCCGAYCVVLWAVFIKYAIVQCYGAVFVKHVK